MHFQPADLSNRVLDLPCVIASHTIGTSERDLILVGRYGYIWEHAPGIYRVVVTSPRVASRHLGVSITRGEEHGFLCDETEARKWAKRLKVSSTRATQAALINEVV